MLEYDVRQSSPDDMEAGSLQHMVWVLLHQDATW